MINRRQLLKTSLGFTALTLLPLSSFAAAQAIDFELAVSYQDEDWFEQPTKTMAFSMPELRIIQGQRVRIRVTNNLEVDTSVHWHGIRLNNAMDGVTGLTQMPIKPNESFIYDFIAPDAGSYWFHSHHNSLEQIAKGLYGALIVEPAVSLNDSVEDLTFLIDDWRINKEFQIDSDFDNLRDLSHGGRMGNILTVNRKIGLQTHSLAHKDYVRLRLINVANSRIQQWKLKGVEAELIAKDGQPLAIPVSLTQTITAGPAERFDLLIDTRTIDKKGFSLNFENREESIEMVRFNAFEHSEKMSEKTPLHSIKPFQLETSLLQRPDKIDHKINVVLEGGAMGSMRQAVYQGEQKTMNELVQQKMLWALSGTTSMAETPMFKAKQGQGIEISFQNNTSFAHNMHLHGHHVFVNGKWQDSILVQRGETLTGQFIADNQGKWLLHCHMIAHAQAGMMTWFEVL